MDPRLYLDEDVTFELAALLRARGHDVVSAHERNALCVDDHNQLEIACADSRAILSFNFCDFLQLAREWSAAGRTHSGIIISYRQYSRGQMGEVLRAIEHMLHSMTADGLANALIVLDSYR